MMKRKSVQMTKNEENNWWIF